MKYPTVAKTIRKLRKKNKISQTVLAKKSGYTTPQFVSNCERGLCYPTPQMIRVMSDEFDVNAAWFVDDILADKRKIMLKEIGA